MARSWLGPQMYGPNDVLAFCLVTIILIIGAPVIALILRGFGRDYYKITAVQQEAWKAHMKSIGKEIRLRDSSPPEPEPADDWGFWTLEHIDDAPPT